MTATATIARIIAPMVYTPKTASSALGISSKSLELLRSTRQGGHVLFDPDYQAKNVARYLADRVELMAEAMIRPHMRDALFAILMEQRAERDRSRGLDKQYTRNRQNKK